MLDGMLDAEVADFPDRPLVITDRRTWTYAAQAGTYDLTSLASGISAGARASERVGRDITSVLGVSAITTGYGITEVTASAGVTRQDVLFEKLIATNGRLRNARVSGDPAIGRRLVDYRVVDPASGAVLPPGEDGELRAKGPAVMRGYDNKPVSAAGLLALVSSRLARFKVPRHLFLVDAAAIPATASGRARNFLLAEQAISMVKAL